MIVRAGFLAPISVERSQICCPLVTGNGELSGLAPAASANAVTPAGTRPVATCPFVATVNGPMMAFLTPLAGPVIVTVGGGGAVRGPRRMTSVTMALTAV